MSSFQQLSDLKAVKKAFAEQTKRRAQEEEKARERAEHYAQICCKLLNELPYESEFLQELTAYVLSRES